MLPDQVILLCLSFILICKSVIQYYSDELHFTPFHKSSLQRVHFTVSRSSLLRKLLLSNSTNGCCIIRLDQQVAFLGKFRCPDTRKFLLREKNTQKHFTEKIISVCVMLNLMHLVVTNVTQVIKLTKSLTSGSAEHPLCVVCVCVYIYIYIYYRLICTPNRTLFRWTTQEEGHVIARMLDERGACRILVERHEGKRKLKDQGVGGSIILKWIFTKWNGVWTGLIWLRTGTGDGLLWMWWWIFRFYKIWKI